MPASIHVLKCNAFHRRMKQNIAAGNRGYYVPRRRAITIKDVAELAGVSQMTVSRVLNLSASVKPDTRERVQSAIAELNYRPNPMARNLARGQALLLGLLYHNSSSAYLSELLVSALRTSRQLGHHLVVEDMEELENGALDGETAAARLNFLSLDGLIIPPLRAEQASLVDDLVKLNTRIVILGDMDGVPDICRISFDDRGGARSLAKYLIDKGHRRIGFVSGPDTCPAARARKMGFDLALTDHDLPLMPELLRAGDYTLRSGVRAAEQLLDLDEPPTAIFCANDDMAAGVMAVAHRRGVKIPDQLSVTGFDDTSIAPVAFPGLTTIHQPISLMARLAVKALSDIEIRDDDENVRRLSEHHIQVTKIEIVERNTVADLT